MRGGDDGIGGKIGVVDDSTNALEFRGAAARRDDGAANGAADLSRRQSARPRGADDANTLPGLQLGDMNEGVICGLKRAAKARSLNGAPAVGNAAKTLRVRDRLRRESTELMVLF